MNRKTLKLTALAVPFWTAVALAAAPAAAAPLLGSAQPFTVVGASTVTNTGASIVQGDLGVWPGLSITGLGSLLLTGTNHQSDSFVQQAQMDALTAYGTLASQAITADLSGQDLGTLGPLQPGIYRFATSAQLTGTLTLDALNDPNALFIFQIGSTLTTASNAAINVINGGANNGLFWQVGTSATLGDNTLFAGNILADQSITLNTGASMLCGRTLALNGAVTLDNNIRQDKDLQA